MTRYRTRLPLADWTKENSSRERSVLVAYKVVLPLRAYRLLRYNSFRRLERVFSEKFSSQVYRLP